MIEYDLQYFGGRGASSSAKGGGGGGLSKSEKTKITSDIEAHTKSQNDSAESNYKRWIEQEENIINNYDKYKKVGFVKNKKDKWWVDHKNTYDSLKSKYEYFKKERKRLGK